MNDQSELFSYEGRDLEVMAFAENYHTWLCDIFRPYIGARTAEVGAGSGNITSILLSEHVQELVAVEPSHEMYPLLERKFAEEKRVHTRQSFFEGIYREYENTFDTVVYVNVLEHVEKDAEELKYVHDALKVGGHVCIFVPALQWLYSPTDKELGHYRRYHAPQLRTLMENADFEVVRLTYFDILGVIPWFVLIKLLQKKIQSGDVALYDKYAIPLMRMIESRITIPVGKNLLAIGKKVVKKDI